MWNVCLAFKNNHLAAVPGKDYRDTRASGANRLIEDRVAVEDRTVCEEWVRQQTTMQDTTQAQQQDAKHLAARAVMAYRVDFPIGVLSISSANVSESCVVCDWKTDASYLSK